MKIKKTYNLSHVTSLETLQREQRVVRQRISQREEDLKLKMYEIPAELAAASANKFIPTFLRGKITDAALNGGKKLINAFFVPETNSSQNLLTYATKSKGVFSVIKKGISLFKGRK